MLKLSALLSNPSLIFFISHNYVYVKHTSVLQVDRGIS